MEQTDITERIKTQFDYLFHRYAYRVVACTVYQNFGNWIAILESPSCGRLLVFQDRGEIIVALGPLAGADDRSGGLWFDLPVVLEFLSRKQVSLESALDHPDAQMARMAAILRPFMDRLPGLFASDGFEAARGELDRIGSRREDEMWSRLRSN